MNRVCSVFTVSFLLVNSPLQAQESGQAGSASTAKRVQLEEVIVTAQKREQSLQDVPISIVALGGELLADNNVSSLLDATKLIPSVKINAADNPRNSRIRIRGVGNSVFGVSIEPSVAVIIDDVPVARSGQASFEFSDVQRIEVLRGPQGTLFGKNSSAGLIHVISRKPANEFEADVHLSYEKQQDGYGENGKISFTASGPVSDSLGLRVSGYSRDNSGHIKDVRNDELLGGYDAYGVRVLGEFAATDNLLISFIAEYEDRDGTSHPFVYRTASERVAESQKPAVVGKDNNEAITQGNDYTIIEAKGATLKIEYDMGFANLTAISGWRSHESDQNLSSGPLDGTGTILVRNGGFQSIETFTQEIRLSSPPTSNLDWTVGALWFDNEVYNVFERFIADIPPAVVLSNPDIPILDLPLGAGKLDSGNFSIDDVVTENLGVFAQATYPLTEQLRLTAGYRYINETLRAKFLFRSEVFDSATDERIDIAGRELHAGPTSIGDENYSYTLSMQYDWGDHSVVYATASRGYRGRAFGVSSTSEGTVLDNAIDPEISINYEVGLKSRLFDNRLEINTTVFHTTFKDFQAQILRLSQDGTSIESILDNADELTTEGVEIDIKVQPLPSLFIFGALAYTEAIYGDFITACYSGQTAEDEGAIDDDGDGLCDRNDISGTPLPNAPKWNASLSTRYETPVTTGGGLFFSQFTGRYQSDAQHGTGNRETTMQEAHSIWDINLGYIGAAERWEVGVFSNNIFDTRYASALFGLSVLFDDRDVSQFLTFDSRRVVGVNARVRW